MSLTVEAVSNGMGSQSMECLVLAAHRKIPATVSITADTGSEKDCLWNTGRRTTARVYFDEVIQPYCEKHGLDARFVRAVDKDKNPLPELEQAVRDGIAKGRPSFIPLYGSRGGQMMQSCTDKWKIRAIRQEARRMGAKRLVTAQGIHFGERGRRVKGFPVESLGDWTIYQDTYVRNIDGEKIEKAVQWCQHYYPLVDMQLGRADAIKLLEEEGLPYLITSECDMCPHKDLPRWERTSPERLAEIAELEASMNGRFFFTDERVPLIQALAIKRAKPASTLPTIFGCGNSICGV